MSAIVLGGLLAGSTANAQSQDLNPIVFVHGGSGSGAQFQSQALRFTSNGYPQDFIRVVEYNSPMIGTILPDVLNQIDATIADLKQKTGRPKVELVGHSLGTTVSQAYLSTPARAANVAHYVNVDGRTATALPGGVPTLALFAGAARRVQGQIVGGTNVTLPDQEHVQAVTSAESFVEMFKFFTGRDPANGGKIAPATTATFPISGRAVVFPQNTGLVGTRLAVFELDARTGQRIGGAMAQPIGTATIDATGNFGPFNVRPGVFHEFVLSRDTSPRTANFFFEPFLRSDALVRLNSGNPGEGLDLIVDRSPSHVALVISRNKEFRGDRGIDADDILSINRSNIMNPMTAPSGFVGSPVAEFIFDAGSDLRSHLSTSLPVFNNIGFIRGIDLFIPANTPRPRPLSIITVPRGNVNAVRTINVRNLPSNEAATTVVLNDFEQ